MERQQAHRIIRYLVYCSVLPPPTQVLCPEGTANKAPSPSRPSAESRSPLSLPASQSSKEPIEERLLGAGEAEQAGAGVGASVAELVLP